MIFWYIARLFKSSQMKKSLLLSSLAIIISFVSYSQAWRNGIVTLKDGTKLEGEVNDLEWDRPFNEVEFRAPGGNATTYSVKDIKDFATDRPVKFESHRVFYDGDSQNLKTLPWTKEPEKMSEAHIFLQVKVDAAIGLLFMTDKGARHHYFIKSDTTVTELLNRSYQNAQTSASILTYPKYKQQLTLVTNDCPNVQSVLKSLQYSEYTLISVIKKINQCKGNTIQPVWEGPVAARKPASFGITVQGFYVASGGLGSYNSDPTSLNYGAGGFLELYSKRKPNSLSFYNELLVKKINPQHGSFSIDGQIFYSLKGDMECSKVKMINAVRFSYPHKTSGRFYFGVGTNLGYRYNTVIINRHSVTDQLIPEGFDSGFEIGFTAMAGETFVIGKSFRFNTELRFDYEYDQQISYSFHNVGLNLQFYLK